MSNEQLHMIINLINSLGVQGKEAFLFYLGFHYLIGPMTWICTMFGIYKLIQFIASRFSDVETVVEIRDRLKIGGHHAYVSDVERKHILNQIQQLMEGNKNV